MAKAQAAFEHMISIAWMLLVFGLVVGALLYLGVLDVESFFPDRMNMGPGLPVKDMVVDDDEVLFIFKSNLGKTLYDFRVNVSQCNNGEGAMSEPMTVPEGKTMKIVMSCPNAIAKGEKFKSEVDVFYTTKTEGEITEHTAPGDMVVGVVEDIALGAYPDVISVSGCFELTEENSTYMLTQNLYDVTWKCFNITSADNIIFDMNGFEVVHEVGVPEGVAVWIRDRSNITVMDGKIYGFSKAIDIEDSVDSLITGMKGSDNWYGIHLHGTSTNNYISNNEMCENPGYDFICDGYGGNFIVSNFFTGIDCFGETVGYTPCPESEECEFGGLGNAIDPIIICNCEQLQSIGDNDTYLGYYYNLGNDIDCSNTSVPGHALNNNGYGFSSIGSYINKFTGALDGAGHTISDLYINDFSSYQGLFGFAEDALIRNLTIAEPVITGGLTMTGSLVGYTVNTNVTYVTVQNANILTHDFVGGLIGFAREGTITDVIIGNVNINGSDYIGGLIGQASNVKIINSTCNGNINGSNYTGGLVGSGSVAEIINSSFGVGNVKGNNFVGGLVGAGDNNIVRYSNASGAVAGSMYVGGLLGSGEAADIYDSFMSGSITGQGYVGGLIGMGNNSRIHNSTADVYLNGMGMLGGLIGMGKDSRIQSSSSIVSISGGGGVVGGLIADGNGAIINNSHAEGTLSTVYGSAGGLVALGNASNVTYSYFKGKVSAGQAQPHGVNAGGLIGLGNNAFVSNSYAEADVLSKNNNSGGLIGGGIGIKILFSHFSGNVSGGYNLGGLIGYGEEAFINGSYARANVTANKTEVGGLIGYGKRANVFNSYFIGGVSTPDNIVGGIMGSGESATIFDSYIVGSVSGHNFAGGMIGNGPDALINNSFSVANVNVNTGSANVGTFIGHGNNANVMSAYSYDYPDDDADKCVGVGPIPSTCVTIFSTSPVSYFYDSANFPMNLWDINVWYFSGNDFPQIDSRSSSSNHVVTLGSCAMLTASGTTYKLINDITGANVIVKANNACFSIDAENVTLDCDGHMIDNYIGQSMHAVFSNKDDTTIKNCTITMSNDGCVGTSCSYAVNLTNLERAYVYNNNFNNCNYSLGAYNVTNSTIINNIIEYGDISGNFRLYNSSGNLIEGNVISHSNSIGMYIQYSDNNRFINNNVSNNGGHGFYFNNAKYNNMTGNNITYNANNGIYFFNSISNNLKNNLICRSDGGNIDGTEGTSYVDLGDNNLITTGICE